MDSTMGVPTALVVGGGPAGLIAAEHLAAAGFKVEVVEHMRSAGRKFQLAGRGGLNITHSEPLEEMLDRYGAARPRMVQAFEAFSPTDLRSWCAELGEETWIGSSGRVFPRSFRATPLLRSWLARLADSGVVLNTGCSWSGWARSDDGTLDPHTSMITRFDGTTGPVRAAVTVMALGGASRPRVGSDGAWVVTFLEAGIAVSELRPANCGMKIGFTGIFTDRFAGTPLKNVSVSAGHEAVRGDVMITSAGVEGGPVYAVTSAVRDRLDSGDRARISFDLQPDLTAERLTERLTGRRRPKDSVSTWLRRCGLAPVEIGLLREVTANSIPTDPSDMAMLIKAAHLDVGSLMPLDRAISTAGGVKLSEIDERFMLRTMPGVFLAGEMLDWEARTGGYLLQACFSTGVAAAKGAAAWLSVSQTPDQA